MSNEFSATILKFRAEGSSQTVQGIKNIEQSAVKASSAVTTLSGQLIKIHVKNTEKATQEVNKAGSTAKDLISSSNGVLTAISGVAKVINGVSETTSKFDAMRNSLVATTGSVSDASSEFIKLQDFAKDTPFTIEESVSAYNKLVNLGLTPSEEAMKSFGEIASGTGKNLSEVIEAVSNSADGDFSGLAEMGINAARDGENIKFTFQNVTTTVKNNSDAIQQYFAELGNTKFAGSMKREMDTYNESIESFGESWDRLVNDFGNMGVNDIGKSAVNAVTGWLDIVNAKIEAEGPERIKQKLVAGFSGIIEGFDTFVEGVNGLLKKDLCISKFFESFLSATNTFSTDIAKESTEIAAGIDELFLILSKNPKALFSADEWMKTSQENKPAIDIIENTRNSHLKSIDDKAAEADKIIHDRKIVGKTPPQPKASDAVAGQAQQQSAGSGKATQRSGNSSQPSSSKNEFHSLADSLRTEEEVIEASYMKRNKIIMAYTANGSEERNKLLKRSQEKYDSEKKSLAEKSRSRDYDALVEQFKSEEEKINETYKKRVEIIKANTAEGSDTRNKYLGKVEEQKKKDLDDLKAKQMSGYNEIKNGFKNKDAAWHESLDKEYEEKKQTVMDAPVESEEERNDLLAKLAQERADKEKAYEDEKNSMILQGASQTFDSLSQMAEAFGGKQSAAYKAMFAISKAFAIADSMIKMQQAMMSALATGVSLPDRIASMATVAATGASIINTLMSIQGAFDLGGVISPGKLGLVGEIGPELVKGPAIVTGRRQTAEKLGSQTPVVNIHNYAGVEVEARQKQGLSGRELEIIVKRVTRQTEASIATSLAKGEGAVTKVLESAYSVRRGKN